MKYVAVVASIDRRDLLAVRVEDGWTLPNVECEQGWIAEAVEAIATEFREEQGLVVTVLRALIVADDVTYFEGEATRASGAACWRPAEALEASLSPGERAALEAWRSDRGLEAEPAAWQRPGWLAKARTWIEGHVAATDVVPIKGAWRGSCVLRVTAQAGTSYFKGGPPRSPTEAQVIEAVATRWPEHVPRTIAADHATGWALFAEVPGGSLGESADDLVEAARLVGRMQRESESDVDRWLDLGWPDRSLEVLDARLDRLLAAIPAGLAAAGVIDEDQRTRLAGHRDRAREIIDRLQALELPGRSLHHEDFRTANVRRTPEGGLVVMDWSDTAIAHPFLTLRWFLMFVGDALHRELTRDAYLEGFRGPLETRRRAFRDIERIGPLHDLLRFDDSDDADAALARGLSPQESQLARHLMARIDASLAEQHS